MKSRYIELITHHQVNEFDDRFWCEINDRECSEEERRTNLYFVGNNSVRYHYFEVNANELVAGVAPALKTFLEESTKDIQLTKGIEERLEERHAINVRVLEQIIPQLPKKLLAKATEAIHSVKPEFLPRGVCNIIAGYYCGLFSQQSLAEAPSIQDGVGLKP